MQIKHKFTGEVIFETASDTLVGANLSGTDLRGANLYGANLTGANLRGANLDRANLENVKGLAQFRIVPSEGAFVGWKKLFNGAIVRLVIPHDAARVNAYGSRKCRAEKAFVYEIFGEPSVSKHDHTFEYKQGEEVIPGSFDPDPRVECSHGIHFFITREEAEEY